MKVNPEPAKWRACRGCLGVGRLRVDSRRRDTATIIRRPRSTLRGKEKCWREISSRACAAETKKPFTFTTIGLLAAIGRRTGVARILGVNFSGFIAWFLWRGIYWSKLPRLEKKVRVAIDWALDVFFSKDFVQYLDERAPAGRCSRRRRRRPRWTWPRPRTAGVDAPGYNDAPGDNGNRRLARRKSTHAESHAR